MSKELVNKSSIGTFRVLPAKDLNGEIKRDAAGDIIYNKFLVVSQGVEISIGGQKIDLSNNRILSCFDSVFSANNLKKSGKIDDTELKQKLEYIEEKGIKLNVVRLPPRTA